MFRLVVSVSHSLNPCCYLGMSPCHLCDMLTRKSMQLCSADMFSGVLAIVEFIMLRPGLSKGVVKT